MQKLVLAAALAAGLVTAASAAQADPLTSVPQDPEGRVIEVRNLCGIGWHRGPYGYCRPNYVHGPYYAPRPYPARCWWVAGPYGARRICAW
jgi:hypothetical protein